MWRGGCSAVIKSSQGCVGSMWEATTALILGLWERKLFFITSVLCMEIKFSCTLCAPEKTKNKERSLKRDHPCISAALQWLSVFLKVREEVHVYMFVRYRQIVSAVCAPLTILTHHLKAISHIRFIQNGQKSEIVRSLCKQRCFILKTNTVTLWMSL